MCKSNCKKIDYKNSFIYGNSMCGPKNYDVAKNNVKTCESISLQNMFNTLNHKKKL